MSITIPEKVYVGFQGRRAEDEVPLGFMTPYTDDAAGEKRRKTVDDWARGYGRTKTFNSVIIDNQPMYGFRMGRAIRRSGYMGAGASYVRIEDPRGFELEISIENLVAVLETVSMERCEFIGELIWARVANSTKNILVAADSDLYRNARKTKAAVAVALTPKNFNIGDKLETVTGEVGIYMGMLYGVTSNWKSEVHTMTSKKPVMAVTNPDGSVTYTGFVDLKAMILEAHTGEPRTLVDSETEIAKAQATNQHVVDYKGQTKVLGWFAKKPTSHTITTKMNEDELIAIFNTMPGSYKYLYGAINGKQTSFYYNEDDDGHTFVCSERMANRVTDWSNITIKGFRLETEHNTVNFY